MEALELSPTSQVCERGSWIWMRRLSGLDSIVVWSSPQRPTLHMQWPFPPVLLWLSIPGGGWGEEQHRFQDELLARFCPAVHFCYPREGFAPPALNYQHSLILFLRPAVPTCRSLEVGYTSDNLVSLLALPTWIFDFLPKDIPVCASKDSAHYGMLQRFFKCFVEKPGKICICLSSAPWKIHLVEFAQRKCFNL